MTVISTLITKYCTVHASDSLITESSKYGSSKPIEWRRSKIVTVHKWRGAMSYWGLAKYEKYKWSTSDWLHEQAKCSYEYSSVEEFAQGLKDKLNEAISRMYFARELYSGIGIHFTAYEYIDNIWIPELFLISNYSDPSYRSLHPEGVRLSRETYKTINRKEPSLDRKEVECRLKVNEYLQEGNMLIYNNGDPALFNPAADAILGMFCELARRGSLAEPDKIKTYLAIARRPIEIISKAQHDFCSKESRVVGGKPHDLAITPDGEYSSSTGDI